MYNSIYIIQGTAGEGKRGVEASLGGEEPKIQYFMALAHLRRGRIRHGSNNCVYFGILAREMLMFELCE